MTQWHLRPKLFKSTQCPNIHKYSVAVILSNDNDVPTIDLTLNEDADQPTHSADYLPPVVEKPFDIIENKILISTQTQSVLSNIPTEATTSNRIHHYKHMMDSNGSATANTTPKIVPTILLSKEEKYPTLLSNITQSVCRLPPKMQIKCIRKYKRWRRNFRTYNGFRFFANQNFERAKQLSFANGGNSFVHSILINWWHSMSLVQKERYSQFADDSYAQPNRPTENNETREQFSNRTQLNRNR